MPMLKIALDIAGNGSKKGGGSASRPGWGRVLFFTFDWIILLGLAYYLFSQKRIVENENRELEHWIDSIEQEFALLQVNCDELRNHYQALLDPSNKPVYLTGTDLSPGSKALVLYNPYAGSEHPYDCAVISLATNPNPIRCLSTSCIAMF